VTGQEPELLTADAERVQRQMESVAVGHYRAFINASEAAHTIRHEIAAVDQHLGTMVRPALFCLCALFTTSTVSALSHQLVYNTYTGHLYTHSARDRGRWSAPGAHASPPCPKALLCPA